MPCFVDIAHALVAQSIGHVVSQNAELSKPRSGHRALTPPGLFPLCDDHSGNMQAIHFWASDLVDHFDSGEVKMGEQRGYSIWGS